MDMLRRLEWSKEVPFVVFGSSYFCCPICSSAEDHGHFSDCRLAKMLIDNGEKDVKMRRKN